jgi:phosphoglucosamine mutase
MMAERLFGTDGIRGRAGVRPLDAATVRRVGAALVRAQSHITGSSRLLTGRDTRESGEWIERELACGARVAGAAVVSAGVAPTPAVAFLTRSLGFDAGVVISASHNPFEDNGIKVFSGGGEKYDERLESEVEALVFDRSWALPAGSAGPVDRADVLPRYVDHVRTVLPDPAPLWPMRIAVDCANGAMAAVAPRLLGDLGFDVTPLACEPEGRNINRDSGSTHPEHLIHAVRSGGHRLGVAFDGDGDRAILVDHLGRVIDGDAVILICAKQLKAEGRLRGNAVVATVMSNIGLEIALRRLGVELIRCPVGDKNVMEEIAKRSLSLGGEQSGHVIFADFLFTGDGLITTLSVLRAMAATGRELAELADDLHICPQVLLNVRVRRKVDLRSIPAIADAISRVEDRLGDRGRLLVRYSGTEPLLRVMLEGQDQEQIEAWAQEIVAEAEKHLA